MAIFKTGYLPYQWRAEIRDDVPVQDALRRAIVTIRKKRISQDLLLGLEAHLSVRSREVIEMWSAF